MLSSSASSSSATAAAEIVKINSRPLVPGELKRLDKQEKESIVGVVGVVKGRNASILLASSADVHIYVDVSYHGTVAAIFFRYFKDVKSRVS